MKAKYPKLKKGEQGYLSRKTCQLCGERTRSNILIEWNIFRGEDSVFKICKSCQKPIKTVKALVKLLEARNNES